MTLSLENKWLWDSWYAHDGQYWHGYFLQADKSLHNPELRHWNVSIGHAISQNLTDWKHLGTCFEPSSTTSWDDKTTWTGSVVSDKAGIWHLFYTGTSHSENGVKQRIGHATSTNMHNWKRVGDGLCLEIDQRYEEYTPGHWHDRACRDPWVIRDPDGDGWLMYFTARVPGIEEPNAGGAIGFATSTDLDSWTLQDPVFTGNFGQLEVPQVFHHGRHWYCLFCTVAEHWSESYKDNYPGTPVSGSHYLMADNPHGPWEVAPGAFLDGSMPCLRYASRILNDNNKLKFLGFLDQEKDGFKGIISNPDDVIVKSNGLLKINRK